MITSLRTIAFLILLQKGAGQYPKQRENKLKVKSLILGIRLAGEAMDRVAIAANISMHQTYAEIGQTKIMLETLNTLLYAIKSGRSNSVIPNKRACSKTAKGIENLAMALGEKDHWHIDLEKVTGIFSSLNLTAKMNCTTEDTKHLMEISSVAIDHTNSLLLAQQNDLIGLGHIYALAKRSNNQGVPSIEHKVKSKLFTIQI